MLNFRKVLLAAAVAGLGLVGTASAQVPTCNITASGQGYVAVEGTTEQLPQLQLSCTAATAFAGPMSISLTASAPFANVARSAANTNLDVDFRDNLPNGTPVVDVIGTTATGTIVLAGPSTMNITLNAINVPNTTFSFWVTGMRINPSGLPVGSTVTVTTTSTSVVIGTGGTTNVAFVAKSLSTVAANPAAAGTNVSICGLAASTTPAQNQGANIVVTAGFLDSLKTSADVQNNPLSIFYVSPASTANGSPTTPGNALGTNQVAGNLQVFATSAAGTRLAITLNNLNTAGVTYYLPMILGATNGYGTNVTLTAYAGATGSTTPTQSVQQVSNSGQAPATVGTIGFGATPSALNANQAGAYAITVSAGGTATVYYGVTASSTAATESFTLPILYTVASPSAVTSFVTGATTASISLVGAVAGSYPQVSANQTAYTSAAPAAGNSGSQGLLNSCSTTLLFPYLTNTSGFDTGVVIANASTGVGSAVTAAAGSCNVTFYGTGGTGGATAATAATYNTGSVASMTSANFAVSTVNAGFSGYGVAICNFTGAHGYAFIYTSGFGGLASDYLAPILSSGGSGYTGIFNNSPF